MPARLQAGNNQAAFKSWAGDDQRHQPISFLVLCSLSLRNLRYWSPFMTSGSRLSCSAFCWCSFELSVFSSAVASVASTLLGMRGWAGEAAHGSWRWVSFDPTLHALYQLGDR